MTAQTRSVDRQWHKEYNKQKMDLGKQAKDARNTGGGRRRKPVVTGPRKAAKSRKRQDWAHTHTRNDTQVP